MKQLLSLLMAAALVLQLSACAPSAPADQSPPPSQGQEDVSITLWTYPVGNWGNAASVASLVASFHRAHPNIHVTVERLTYDDGDARVEEAIAGGAAPDLVFEGPERLVAGWGARGLMADLSDLWEEEPAQGIYPSIRAACHRNGAYYTYPICMTTHCMAVNRDLFEAAGALQYLDEDSRTWTTDGFLQAVAALRAYGLEDVVAVFCGGQAGDQGTRALVTNLYGGSFTDSGHTAYTVSSEENIRALRLLQGLEGVRFDPELTGPGEIALFCKGELAMTFCWNVSLEVTHTVANPDLDFDVLPMAFPTDGGTPHLAGGIWGFGVFDNGDPARVEAAKTFIRFMTESDAQYTRAVLTATHWPVRDVGDIYVNDELMTEYGVFTPYMDNYYQITPGWTQARAAWWAMLQDVGNGADPAQAAAEFDRAANSAASG